MQKCQNRYDLPDFCPADASEIVKIAKSALWSTFALLKSKVLQALYISSNQWFLGPKVLQSALLALWALRDLQDP